MSKSLATPMAANQFIVAPLSAHAWAVAYARKLIPGAILRTREAALRYAAALAGAMGSRKTRIRVLRAVSRSRVRRSARTAS
ncbi:MAG TPA: hypothetical protein VMK05_15515 [Burkholderiales bacterium]|nr:hypothetical protein [Burkholderiales bacterium]